MRKICIINQKGGVAKTTTTVNLAAGLAKHGRVLAIDLDPQGNLGRCLNVTSDPDTYDLLVENIPYQQCIAEVSPSLHVITASTSLTKAQFILAGEQARELVLRKALMSVQGYEYILLDCPPSLGLLNQNALLFATEAFIPVATEPLAFEALELQIKAIQRMNEVFNHELRVGKIIPTLHDARNKINKEILTKLQTEYYEYVTSPIRISSKLRESPMSGKPVFEYAKSSRAAKDYLELTQQVMNEPTPLPQISSKLSA